MGWLKVFFMALLLVSFSLVLPGLVSGESTPLTFQEIYNEEIRIWKELNRLAVNSEATLIDIQRDWPDLVRQVSELGIELAALESSLGSELLTLDNELKVFNQDFSTKLVELTLLKSQFGELLSSVETLRTTYTSIEEDLRSMKFKTNLGLAISITAFVILAGYFIYDLSKKTGE
jgi:hypothetical protein